MNFLLVYNPIKQIYMIKFTVGIAIIHEYILIIERVRSCQEPIAI